MDVKSYQIKRIKQYGGVLKCLFIVLFICPVILVGGPKSAFHNLLKNSDHISNNFVNHPNDLKITPSSNSQLSKLIVYTDNPANPYSLAPKFDPTLGTYTLKVVNTVSQINVQPVVAASAISSLTVNGSISSNNTPVLINLNYGSNNIVTIKVIAEDGISTSTYVLIITRVFKSDQTVTQLSKLPTVTYGYPDIDIATFASSSSGLPLIVTSSDNTVAQIINNKIHIVGVGKKGFSVITAYADSNSFFNLSNKIIDSIKVNKANQHIISPTIPTLLKGDNFSLSGFSSSSGLPLTFKISDTTITPIVNNILYAVQLGTTTLTISQYGNENINSASPVLIDVTVEDLKGDNLIVHPALTPNGDGINDFFLIEGLSNYKSNSVVIANTYGNIVYTTTNYNNSTIRFDGRLNGQYLPKGTYFYYIEYVSSTSDKRHKSGYLVIKY